MTRQVTGMRPWWSARDRRDANQLLLQLMFPGVAMATAAAVATVWLTAGMASLRTLPDWVTLTQLISGGVVAVLIMVGWGFLVHRWWPRLAPTGSGFATRSDVEQELSVAAARRKAKVTRPLMGRAARRKAPAADIGIPFHQAAWGDRLWLPLENPTGVIAPTQSGKSLTDLIHKALDAPGALLTTSTKPDLFRLTALHRERLHGPGSVQLLDLTGSIDWPHQVRWNLIAGCDDWRVAVRRAKALVAGVRPGDKSGGNHKFFESRASEVLACYLQAAAISSKPVAEFVRWCMDEEDHTAADTLMANPATADHALILRKAQTLVAETRDGIWESIRDAISCLTDPLTRAVVSPQHGDYSGGILDVAGFLANAGSIYVVGSEDTAADLAPLVTAFVEHILFESTQLALTGTAGHDRLDPPLTAVLDELPNICPLPKLPATISDSAGRGVLIHWAAQSKSQLVSAFGGEGADTLIDNTTALTVFGGLKSKETLEWLSALCGRRIEERQGRKSEPLGINLDRQISQERVELLSPGQIRELPPGRVLVIFRSMPPLIAVTRKAWELPSWGQLQADRQQLRNQLLDDVDTTLQLEGAPA